MRNQSAGSVVAYNLYLPLSIWRKAHPLFVNPDVPSSLKSFKKNIHCVFAKLRRPPVFGNSQKRDADKENLTERGPSGRLHLQDVSAPRTEDGQHTLNKRHGQGQCQREMTDFRCQRIISLFNEFTGSTSV